MTLNPDTRPSYAAAIDSILASSDLRTVSAKQIRKALQESIGHDLSSHKDDINTLIRERFDQVESKNITGVAEQSNDEDNAVDSGRTHYLSNKKRQNDSEAPSDSVDDAPPRKQRPKSIAAEDDAAFAARLQAEEDSRARTTRGTASGKRQTPKKSVKKKSKSVAKIKATDDSDLGSADESEKSVNRSGAFHKPYTLSQPLGELLGETSLSRPQTVKKIWEYVKANGLQNPDDKRQIVCDDAMRAVFKCDMVHMFTMNKILSKHLYEE